MRDKLRLFIAVSDKSPIRKTRRTDAFRFVFLLDLSMGMDVNCLMFAQVTLQLVPRHRRLQPSALERLCILH